MFVLMPIVLYKNNSNTYTGCVTACDLLRYQKSVIIIVIVGIRTSYAVNK